MSFEPPQSLRLPPQSPMEVQETSEEDTPVLVKEEDTQLSSEENSSEVTQLAENLEKQNLEKQNLLGYVMQRFF